MTVQVAAQGQGGDGGDATGSSSRGGEGSVLCKSRVLNCMLQK